jgi:hypothetical protein
MCGFGEDERAGKDEGGGMNVKKEWSLELRS